jgi:hypothetical protein
MAPIESLPSLAKPFLSNVLRTSSLPSVIYPSSPVSPKPVNTTLTYLLRNADYKTDLITLTLLCFSPSE